MESKLSALGKYELLHQLGRGAMGIVYRARDTVLDREVAIKVLRTESEVFPDSSERFSREARACARLHHQNIITIHDFGEAESASYIVMELLQGMDWKTALKTKSSLPLTRKLDLMAQVCDGLAHAHQQGIVHRDLKPSNFFIHLRTQAKILDFGLVRLSTSVLTRTGTVLGTPNYMAPEQILGQTCDFRSDLFSAAIVFFEFLTYRHPFQAPFIPKRIATGAPEWICEIDPRLPTSLQDTFVRAFERDPDRRFQSGTEFAAALRGTLAAGGFEPEEEEIPMQAASAANSAGSDDETQIVSRMYSPRVAEVGNKPDSE